jgi:SpoVK/Ycf46/Vps4 family AAA+-type ATPase
VILPDHVRAELEHLLDRVRLRPTVIDDWGMRPGGLRGRGITALFAGESGTGKTMAAEALAGELGTPLFHVNLASVVDKYIGETEKNLERVFSEAENLDGVLLFDEADAVFGKRSEVSDARDRYANLEVAYLLQRIEAFDGLAILTTNLRSNLDAAFARRLDCILDFPSPDAELRAAIWRACLAEAGAVVTDEEYRRLASLEMAGGAIRSSSISAAFMAAGAGEPVSFVHAARGAKREWVKLGLLSFPLQSVLDASSPQAAGGG